MTAVADTTPVACLLPPGGDGVASGAERWRVLLDLTADELWECDAELRLTRLIGGNPHLHRLFGPFLGQALADAVDQTVPAEDVPRWLQAMQARQAFKNIVIPVRGAAEREWFRLRAAPVTDDQGRFHGYWGTATRVTEERRRIAAERRRQQLEGLGQLAGGVAHEFNNLLVPITMLSKLALARCGDDETLRTFLTTIHESGWKAAQIVRSVLTYARQMTPSAGAVVCGEIVAERLKLLRQALPPSVVFEVDIADRTSQVMGHGGELSQIVVNLVTNAAEALDDCGTIRCDLDRVTLSPQDQRLFGLATPEVVRLSIADNGRGIPPDLRDRIFQPFFTTKAVGQGTGLGLSVVEGIIKDWGGQITVQSNLGIGTTVTVLLPVLEA